MRQAPDMELEELAEPADLCTDWTSIEDPWDAGMAAPEWVDAYEV